MPFGSRDPGDVAAATARQLARRVVERFERSALLVAKPVFLVALSDERTGSGMLVFGSSPDASLAAQYARGLDATHALFGVVERQGLRASVVRAADATEVAQLEVPVDEKALPAAEGALALRVAEALGVQLGDEARGRLGTPVTDDALAYRSLLVAMDLEMTATVLRRDRPGEALEAERGAIASYLAAVRADPGCEPAEERLLFLAAQRLEAEESERAMELLEDVITATPRSWRANYMLGEARREAGLAAQAVVAYEHADALHPLSDADLIRVAELYLEADAPDAAIAKLRRVKQGSAQFAAAQAQLGLVFLRKSDAHAAVAALERARAAGLRSPVLYARLGQAYATIGEAAKARAVFEEGARETRGWEALTAYAAYLHAERDLSAAIDLYRRALAEGAPQPTRLNLARALVLSDRRAEAREELRGLVESELDAESAAQSRRLVFGLEDPGGERRLESAGQVAVGAREGDVEDSRRVLAEIAGAHPDLWEAHFGLGLALRRLGDASAAETALRRSLALWPEQPDALHELGVSLLAQSRLDEAVLTLESAARVRPDDPGYLADVGFAYMLAGNLHAARNRLERALRLDPEDEITKQYVAELQRRETATS